MYNLNLKESSQSQRCKQCKTAIKPQSQRYFCCDRKHYVCLNCSKNACKQCGKKRESKINYVQCYVTKCRRWYDRQDMFQDYIGKCLICPKCLRKDYEFYYNLALKNNTEPDKIKLSTKSIYNYQVLVQYFKNWCFSCANKIGDQDAYEMIRGPRICGNCASLNFEAIDLMIRCISCEGYIHTLKQIFSSYGIENEVICIYCAQKSKEIHENVSVKEENQMKSQRMSRMSGIKSSAIKSALKIFKFKSNDNHQDNQTAKKSSNASRISSLNSVEFQVQNMPLEIKRQRTNTPCSICNSCFDESNLFLIKKSDKNQAKSILRLMEQQKQDLRLCPLCFGDQIEDRGQTIQFDSAPTRNIKMQEENIKEPEISVPKISIAKQGASQNVFKQPS